MLKIKKTYTGTTLKGRLINDDLVSSATGYWEILDDKGRILETGNVTIDGELYKQWDGSAKAAYIYMATLLGITEHEFTDGSTPVEEVVEGEQTELGDEQVEGFADES